MTDIAWKIQAQRKCPGVPCATGEKLLFVNPKLQEFRKTLPTVSYTE
jgi:hypothetical protein